MKRNISLVFDFLRYITDHPELINKIPNGGELEFLDKDFPLTEMKPGVEGVAADRTNDAVFQPFIDYVQGCINQNKEIGVITVPSQVTEKQRIGNLIQCSGKTVKE